jgi:lambda family phage portal protein
MNNGTAHGGRMRPHLDAVDKELAALKQAALGAATDAVFALSGGAGGYETASPGRLRRKMSGLRGGSADSFRDERTRASLRKQCQHLSRNNVLARGLVQRLIDMVVGSGFTLQVKTLDEEWNKAAAWLFSVASKEWDGSAPPEMLKGVDPLSIPTLDIRGRSSLSGLACEAVRTACFDGDMGLVLTDRGQMQAVEGERIRNPDARMFDGPIGANGERSLVGGVEMDSAGMPICYHIATWEKYNSGQTPTAKTTAVPAESFVFLANPLQQVTGATRGEPQFQAAVDRFEHLAGISLSVRVAARIQACLAIFITSENPGIDQLLAPGEETEDEDGNERKEERISPGMMKRMRPGESVTSVVPSQPGGVYAEFLLTEIVQICADIGLPLPLALLDGRQVNLSSIRSVLQFAWRNFERWQEWLKIELYCRIYAWRIAMFIRQGLLPYRDDWSAHEWITPPPPVMDPKVEVEAARGRVDACFSDFETEMQLLWGRDFSTTMRRLAKQKKEMDALGIRPAAAPGSGPGSPQNDKPEKAEQEQER